MDWVGGLIGTDETANSYRSEDVSHPHYNGPQVHYYHWNKYYKDIVSTDITNSYYSGSISGNDNVGGLVGLKDAGYITNCYSYAKIVGRNNVGGIAGTATGTSVSNSTFTLTIKSNVATNPNISASSSNVGRIYGSRGENVVIGALGSQESNRALTQTSVMLCGVAQDIVDDEQNGTSVGPSMLKLKANYVSWGWNFDENWNILETECYPYKKYQAAPPVIESSLVSHATEIHGKSLDGGTVYMYYKDREPVSTQCIGNQWSFTTEELQSGAQVQLYADVDNITPSYFTSATVKYPGSGTETDPYRIYSAEDLQGASNSGYYRIMNDIDLTNWIRENSPTTGWQPIGRNSTAATYIDGDNHKITGLWINTTDDYNGLFSNYSAGYIKNLKVEVAKDKYVRGGNYTGILIGRMYNGQIINCEVLGNAEGTEKIGGVVGYTENSTLKEVFYQGVVSTSFAGANIGGLAGHTKNVILDYCGTEAIVNATGNVSNVGGLVGHADGGTFTQALSELEIVSTGSESNVGGLIGKSNVVLSNCASFGIVSASGDNSYTGGLVGISTNSITNCYSTASTSGTLYTAGLVGYSYGSIDKCYAQGDVTGVMYGAGVVGELDGTSASLSNSVALNNIISLTAQSSWGCRVVGGFKNGCNEPDMNNYALNTMQVSLNNVPQRKTDDNIEGIAKTETELMSSEFYMNLGWDMGNTWLIQEGREYPYLNISKGDDVVLATGITLSNSSITIKPGETATLLASVMPNGTTQKSVTWSSSNQYVATVENGIVTALTTGTTTINATTTDGTNLSASCVVTVSSNASDEPTSLEPSTDISVYPNVLYFNDVEQRAGDFNLELNMKCAQENITAFQCDVYLPEGVSWKTTTDKRGNVSYILPIFNEERTDASYHTISPIAINADGSYSIIVYSMDLESILGTDGALMTLPLEISEDMEATDYNLIIRNIVMTDINQKEKNVAKVVSRLTIPKYELGDANGDGNINITDIVAVIAYIRGNASPDFVYDAADISCDGVINITDIVGIISIIRSGVSSAKPMNTMQEGRLLATRSDSKLIADSFSVEEGTLKANAHLCMNNADEEFTAFQCDVVFPEGISWASSIDALGNKKYEQPVFNTESNRTDASYHTADAGMNADGSMNVMVYSMSQDVFFGESGAILDMPFAFDEDLAPGVYNITLKNIVMTRPDQSQTKPEDYTFTVIVGGDVNGIDAVSTNSIQAENENIYDLQGRKIQSVKKGIYIENGKKVIIK
ncbi:MAG: GLUG motif-containing protein [Prevotellaceae bacterium]|nr:GLUG motif-containing protein [Prevotellaceae bacterium]